LNTANIIKEFAINLSSSGGVGGGHI